MSTFTIRVTSSATNAAGTAYGQQPDLGAPSFFDMIVTNSTDPLISNGVYDAYCLNPFANIFVSPTTYSAVNYAANVPASFVPIGFSSLTQAQVDQVNWVLAQNFTSDAKYGGQFNYGEVQVAIWKIVGFTDAQIAGAGLDLFLNDNNRNVVSAADANFLVSSAQAAVASGNGVVPTDAFFTELIDPYTPPNAPDSSVQNVQPLIVQLQSAKLGNYVWLDTDADGIQDGNEVGVDNVIVELWSNGVKIASTATGDDFSTVVVEQGYYQFTGLKAGDYQVKFVAPAGQFLTTQDANGNSQDAADSDANQATGFSQIVTLAAGESNQTIDAGLLPPVQLSAIGDRVWEDKNANGQQDQGENGIANATVRLYTCVNGAPGVQVGADQTTDGSGNYSFNNLQPGDYIVEFVTPNGYTRTQANVGGDATDSDNVGGLSGCYTLSPGENEDTVDAGFYRPAAIGDRVWLDTNANGQQDGGESGVNGVRVELYACVNNLPSGAMLAFQNTSGDGNYNFSNLMPGDYIVKFITPAGYTLTTANVGNDATDSDAGVGGLTGCYNLESGETDNTVDAGLVQLASIGDRVWEDKNANGQQDQGENGIANATVRLYTCVNGAPGVQVGADQTTDGSGNYSFNNLQPGDYIVEFVTPNGYTRTQANVGGDATDSDNVGGLSGCYTLSPGENEDTVDAGFYRPAAIGDRVWLDTNANGQQDGGESGVNGVRVELYACVNNLPSGAMLAFQNTSGDGNYNFSNLMPGDYIVKFITPAGYTLTTANVGADATDSDANVGGLTGCYNLESGETDNSVDAGLYIPDSDLSITKTDGLTCVTPGQVVTYTIVASNSGPATATDALVSDIFPSILTNVSWTSVAAGGASGNELSGTGNINDYVTLVAGSTITYTVTGTVASVAALSKFSDFGAGVNDTNLGQSITINGVNAEAFYLNSGYQTTNTVLWERNVPNDHGLGVWSNGEPDPVANGGDVNEISNQLNNEVIRLTKSDGESWTSLWVSSLDSGGSGSAEAGTLYWSNSATPDLNSLPSTNKFTFKYGDFGTSVEGDLLTLNPAGFDPSAKYLFFVAGPNAAGTNNDYLFWKATTTGASLTNTATVTAPNGFTDSNPNNNSATDTDCIKRAGIDVEKYVSGVKCTTVQNGCGEGANVSYWKNNCVWDSSQNSYGWKDTGCKSSTTFNAAFGVNCTNGTKTLLQILQGTGTTALDAYQRECVAAYLNASHTKVDYSYTKDEVCSQVKYSIEQNSYDNSCKDFSKENNLGCNWTTSKTTWNCTVDTDLKDADTSAQALEVKAGSTVNYTFVVKNTGDAALTDVVLTDVPLPPGGLTWVGKGNGDNILDVGETWTYKASEVAKSGLNTDTATVTAKAGTVTVSDSDPANYNGSGALKGSIGDKVWNDVNCNGIQDAGETGIAGVTVKLFLAGKDGVCGTADDQIATTTTNSTGYYQFNYLNAGQYQIKVIAPSGYYVTKQNQGTNDAIDSDIGSNGTTATITLGAGEQNLTVDGGLYKKAIICDRVWYDSDKDGIQDSGENGCGGVKVYLQNSSGTTIKTCTTDSNGNYSFGDVDAGSYRLCFDKSGTTYSSKSWSTKDVSSNQYDTKDSDVNSSGYTSYFSVKAGDNQSQWDAGITPIVIDLNGDGIHTVSRSNSLGSFDLLGTGNAIQSGWLSGDDGFLAVDRNGNGRIDNIAELFGGNAKGAGFAMLASYDSNGDGVVNADDAGFADLRIWQDANGNHQTDAGELITLTQAGVSSLKVPYDELPFLDANDNLHLERSSATLADGSSVDMTDVYFNVSAADAAAAGVKLPSMADLMSDSSSLDSLLAGSTSNAAPANSTGNPSMDFDPSVLDAMKQLAHLYDQAAVYA